MAKKLNRFEAPADELEQWLAEAEAEDETPRPKRRKAAPALPPAVDA